MSGKATTDPYPLPKETVDAALALMETLRPLCAGHSRLVVQLALAVRLAEVLVEQASDGGKTDPRLALVGLLAFIGHVVESYQHLTGEILPPFSLGLVLKAQETVLTQVVGAGKETVH